MSRASKSNSKSKSVEVMDVDPNEADASEADVEGAVKETEGEQEVGEVGDEHEDDDDEEEEEEGEYEVEKVLDHKQKAGKYIYLVAWKGYGPEHNTWEPEAHVAHAEEAVSAYWASKPKKSIKNEPATNKRARTLTAPNGTPSSKSKATQGRSKRKSPMDDDDEMPGYDETHDDDLNKYLDVQNWEGLVASVDTIERGQDETLIVYMTMIGGEKGGMPTEVVYKRCPQKVLAFYEAHLKWKKVE